MPTSANRRLTHQMRLVELRFGCEVPEVLRQLRTEGLAVGEIAHRLEIPYGTAHRWLVRYGLDNTSLIRRALRAMGRGAS